jgi:hypothetical protein
LHPREQECLKNQQEQSLQQNNLLDQNYHKDLFIVQTKKKKKINEV